MYERFLEEVFDELTEEEEYDAGYEEDPFDDLTDDFEDRAAPRRASGPSFRLSCAGGCTVGGRPLNEVACRRTLREDLVRAARFANRAAQLLEASPRAQTTRAIYRRIFRHNPERPVPWARGFRDSGALTAHRFRRAAEELNGGRVLDFRCMTHPTANAGVPHQVNGRTNRTQIWLFPRYWTQRREHRSGTLVHEMLHLYYLHLIVDRRGALARRVNAHCYEWLVLSLNGITPNPVDFAECGVRPSRP